MKPFVVGLSYKTAPVEVRERLAGGPSRSRCYGCRLKLAGNLSEVVMVLTCNRVEVYGVAPQIGWELTHLLDLLSPSGFDFSSYVYLKEGAEAIEHLFSVSSGLDSMVVGETEITCQVKQAYQSAQEAKLTGRITNRLFQTALQVAKEVRTQTGIGRGATSVGSVAVELAERIFDRDLSEKTVMIVGAGKMGEACVRHLAKKAAHSILVANRSFDKAEKLALEFGGRAVRFEKLLPAMTEADIVVSSTGCPDTILNDEDLSALMPQRRNRPLFLIDIAVPRDIDPAVQRLENVYLYNLDHLEKIASENVRLREGELAKCRAIIAQRAAALMERFTPKPRADFQTAAAVQPPWMLNALTVRPC